MTDVTPPAPAPAPAPAPDEATIDDLDINSLEQAIDSLLNKTQQNLGYPYQAADSPNQSASVALNYRFHAELEVTLDTTWTLFTGFTLTNITLRTEVSKSKNVPGELFIRLSALFVVGNISCEVVGMIPRLSTQDQINFALQVKAAGTLNEISPTALVSALTNGGSSFAAVTAKLDPSLKQQIESGDGGVSFVTTAQVVVTRQVDGTFFLRQLAFQLYADIQWPIIPSRLELSELACRFEFARNAAADPWGTSINLYGSVLVNNATFKIAGDLDLGEHDVLNLTIDAPIFHRTSVGMALEQLVGPTSASQFDAAFNLPPGIALPESDADGFLLGLSLKKDTSGWYIDNAVGYVTLHDLSWYPVSGLDVALESLYFQGNLTREVSSSTVSPSLSNFIYSALFGGLIYVAGIPLQALVAYKSKEDLIVVTCSIGEGMDMSLQDIASDPLLNPPSSTDSTSATDATSSVSTRDDPDESQAGHNLIGVAASDPVPDSVPVDLSWCDSAIWQSNASFTLQFIHSTLASVQLKAEFVPSWRVTSTLTLKKMGIYFDITNPLSSSANTPSIIKGYAYGQLLLANSVQLFAFVAGVREPELSEYLVGLSVTYEPNAAIGMECQRALADPKLLGQVISTTGWLMPDSAPAQASVSDALTSVEARLLITIKQTAVAVAAGSYTTKISSFRVTLDVSGSWPIFAGIELTGLSVLFNAFPASISTQNQTTYFAGLAGQVSSSLTSVGQTNYNVRLIATIVKSVSDQQPVQEFTVAVVVSYAGQSSAIVPLSTFFDMPLTGLNNANISGDPSARNIPPELSNSPTKLLAQNAAACVLVVKKLQGTWVLEKISATLTQNDPWIVITDKLVISQSTVSLIVLNPRQSSQLSPRSIKFSASVIVTIGSLVDVQASVYVNIANGVEDTLIVTLTVSNSNFQQVLSTLTGTQLNIPPGTPAITTYTATLTVTCKKTTNGFKLTQVAVTASTTVQWSLGPFSVEGLAIVAVIDHIDTTAKSTTVAFSAAARVAETQVDIELAYVTRPSERLTVTIMTPLEPVKLVDSVVSGGLATLNPPTITNATGFGNYSTTPVARGFVIFEKTTSWTTDSLGFTMSNPAEWVLVGNNFLVAKNLNLSLVVSGLSTPQKVLSVSLGVEFHFAKRPPPPGQQLVVTCVANATSKELAMLIDTSNCTMAQLLYTVTGGAWNPPNEFQLPSIAPTNLIDKLVLTVNWDEGYASFQAVLQDWRLTKEFPKLIGIKEPRFEASITRSKYGGWTAVGQLAGSAIMSALGVEVPMTYELPTGPFRVCGIDVKQSYDLAKRLYQILKESEGVADAVAETTEIIAELAEFAGVADVATDVAAAFLAAGVLKTTIDIAISTFFGSDSSGPPDDLQNDPSSNLLPPSNVSSDGTPIVPTVSARARLVLGGTLLSPGIANSASDLYVYPKDKFGNYLQGFDSANLSLEQVAAGDAKERINATWSTVPFGCKTSILRPAAGELTLTYSGAINIVAKFNNIIQSAPSVFSLTHSKIQVADRVPYATKAVAVLVPYDQYGLPRLGPGAAPELKVLSFNREDGNGGPAKYDADQGFSVRNDGLLLPFSLPLAGTYILKVVQASGPPADVLSVNVHGVEAVDPNRCVASGEGLCSGPPDKIVAFEISLRDTGGQQFNIPTSQNIDLHVLLTTTTAVPSSSTTSPSSTSSSTRTTTTELNWSPNNNQAVISYRRPALGSYAIDIIIDGIVIEGGTIDLLSTNTPVAPSIAHSQCSLQADTVMISDTVFGSIKLYDNLGMRWRQQSPSLHSLVKIVYSDQSFFGLTLRDDLDAPGACQFMISPVVPQSGTIPAPRKSSLVVQSASNISETALGSPLEVTILPAPVLSAVRAYGPGVASVQNGVNTVYVGGVDQYGNSYAVRVGVTVKVTVTWRSQSFLISTTMASPNTFTYQLPPEPESSEPVIILLESLPGTDFAERLYLVNRVNPGAAVPSKSFISWTDVDVTGNRASKATLYAIGSSGARTYAGGDFVQVTSVQNTPITLIQPVVDNNDGTYTLHFTLTVPSARSRSAHIDPAIIVALNGENVQGSPFSFPLTPSPMVTCAASGNAVSDGFINQNESFVVSCLDASGQLTSSGFHSAEACLLRTGITNLSPLDCQVGPIANGRVTIEYMVPLSGGAGTYHLYVFVNNEPIAGSPFQVQIQQGQRSIDDIKEACFLTHYTLLSPTSQWGCSASPTWTQTPVNALETKLTSTDAIDPASYWLNLPLTDQWLDNGFIFAFDLAIEELTAGPIGAPARVPSFDIMPRTQPAGITISLRFTANSAPSNGDAGARDLGEAVWYLAKRTEAARPIALPKSHTWKMGSAATTLAFLYLLSPAEKTYTLVIFHSGYLITQQHWAMEHNPLPQMGFTIQRRGGTNGTVKFANVMTIPSYFRSSISTPGSSNGASGGSAATMPMTSEIDFTTAGASAYIDNTAGDGRLSSNGLVVTSRPDQQRADIVRLNQVAPAAGAPNVAVFALKAVQAYGPATQPNLAPIACIGFAGFYYNTRSRQWMDWEGNAVSNLAPGSIKVAPLAPLSTVLCINGPDCATVFVDGRFQFSCTERANGSAIPALTTQVLQSWRTNVTWAQVRAYPPFRSQAQHS